MRSLRWWWSWRGGAGVQAGQSVVEYSLIAAFLVIGCVVSFSFVQQSIQALHEARQDSLNSSVVALAKTSTPNPLAVATETPTVAPTRTPFPTATASIEPTATATLTPIPTVTPTTPPTATAVAPTPTPSTPALPSCADVPWWYSLFGWCQ